jgi:hypothetical protein
VRSSRETSAALWESSAPPIVNQEGGYVVDFGRDSYVVHESKLTPFQGHAKAPEEQTKKKDVKIEKRRGGGRAKRGETPSDEE